MGIGLRGALLAAGLLCLAPRCAEARSFELLGETVVPRVLAGSGVPVGGLSGLSYDPERGVYFAVSDDGGRLGPARIYELGIELDQGRLQAGGVVVLRAFNLRRADGSLFPKDSIDPESLARTVQGNWIVASEGHAKSGVAAALLEFTEDGQWLGALPLPRAFRPRKRSGIRHNMALESATISPDRRWLFSGTENALLQDGPAASPAGGSASRLLRIDLTTRKLASMYLYRTEPIAAAPDGDKFSVNGLVDLLALDGERLLALERSFTVGEGNAIKLFLIDLATATDVKKVRRLGRRAAGRRRTTAAAKCLLLDLAELGIVPDNIEGMTFGPDLADGRRMLVLVADDNFNPAVQSNQLLVLALEPSPGCRGPGDPGARVD